MTTPYAHPTVRQMQAHTDATAKEVEGLHAQLASLRGSTSYQLAATGDRAAAERPILAKIAERQAAFLREQEQRVKALQADYRAATRANLQRKAAIANPSHAAAMAALVSAAGPAEARKLADLLAAQGDASGAYGLRMAVSRFESNHDTAAAVTVALKAGTQDSDTALRSLVMAKQEYAKAVRVATNDPTRALAAAHEAQLIEAEDGTIVHLSEKDIDALVSA